MHSEKPLFPVVVRELRCRRSSQPEHHTFRARTFDCHLNDFEITVLPGGKRDQNSYQNDAEVQEHLASANVAVSSRSVEGIAMTMFLF